MNVLLILIFLVRLIAFIENLFINSITNKFSLNKKRENVYFIYIEGITIVRKCFVWNHTKNANLLVHL